MAAVFCVPQAAAHKLGWASCILTGSKLADFTQMATFPLPPEQNEADRTPLTAPPRLGEASPDRPLRKHHRLRSVLGLLGPSMISGAANDDPCAIGTSAQAGAAFGYSLLW